MDDLISRQAALDALTTYIYNVYKPMVGKKMPTDKCRQAAESVLGELPTVQPKQPKRGYWCGPFCSECGVSQYNWFTVVSKKSEPIGHWDFCPGCGAKMEER